MEMALNEHPRVMLMVPISSLICPVLITPLFCANWERVATYGRLRDELMIAGRDGHAALVCQKPLACFPVEKGDDRCSLSARLAWNTTSRYRAIAHRSQRLQSGVFTKPHFGGGNTSEWLFVKLGGKRNNKKHAFGGPTDSSGCHSNQVVADLSPGVVRAVYSKPGAFMSSEATARRGRCPGAASEGGPRLMPGTAHPFLTGSHSDRPLPSLKQLRTCDLRLGKCAT